MTPDDCYDDGRRDGRRQANEEWGLVIDQAVGLSEVYDIEVHPRSAQEVHDAWRKLLPIIAERAQLQGAERTEEEVQGLIDRARQDEAEGWHRDIAGLSRQMVNVAERVRGMSRECGESSKPTDGWLDGFADRLNRVADELDPPGAPT